jgi:hypothetical protein
MRTLVVILSETRSHNVTYANIKHNLIDELNADLCLCIGVKPDYDYQNPFYQTVKYKFLYHEPADDPNFVEALEYAYNYCSQNLPVYEKMDGYRLDSYSSSVYVGNYDNQPDDVVKFLAENTQIDADSYMYNGSSLSYTRENNESRAVKSDQNVLYKKRLHYRDFLKIKHHIFSETDNPEQISNFSISTGIHMFFTWFLWKNLREYGLVDKYDRFVITRSDFIYQLPHPKLELLDARHIWVPDGQQHGGVCDRHAVLSPMHLEKYLNVVGGFFQKSNEYYAEIQKEENWNMEKILKMHLEKEGVINKVAAFPYVMYAVREITGTTRWSFGDYSEKHGYCIKYPEEYKSSNYFKTEYDRVGYDINTFYKMYGWLQYIFMCYVVNMYGYVSFSSFALPAAPFSIYDILFASFRLHPRLCAARPLRVPTWNWLHKSHVNPCFLQDV